MILRPATHRLAPPLLTTRQFSLTSSPQRNTIYNPIRSEDEFETLNLLSASSRIPLITLWSTSFCPSCKIITPLLHDLISSGIGQSHGGLSFAEVVLDSPTLGPLAMRYAVNSMPTLLSFDRQEAQLETRVTDVGRLKSREFLEKWLETEAGRHGEGGAGGGLFSFLGRK